MPRRGPSCVGPGHPKAPRSGPTRARNSKPVTRRKEGPVAKNETPGNVASDDLSDLLGENGSGDPFDDLEGLLKETDADADSVGWMPEKAGDTVVGIVVRVGTEESDFEDKDGSTTVPVVTVESEDGTKYRVVGYRSILKREMNEKNPHIGDLFVARYYGTVKITKGKFAGKDAYKYGVGVKHRNVAGACRS